MLIRVTSIVLVILVEVVSHSKTVDVTVMASSVMVIGTRGEEVVKEAKEDNVDDDDEATEVCEEL